MNDTLFQELLSSVVEGGHILKQENFITLNMRQLAACMRRIGLVNSGDNSLQQLTRWCKGNKLSFNLDGVRAGVKIKVEITAREHMETVDLLITQD